MQIAPKGSYLRVSFDSSRPLRLTFDSVVFFPIRGCDKRGRSETIKVKKAQSPQAEQRKTEIELSPGCKLGNIDGQLMLVLSSTQLILHYLLITCATQPLTSGFKVLLRRKFRIFFSGFSCVNFLFRP